MCPRLLSRRVLHAEGCLGQELEPLFRDRPATDDAPAVLAALEPREGLVDEADPRFEHRLPRDVKLARLGLAGYVGGVLVHDRDVPAALPLRDRQPLAEPCHRAGEIRPLAREPLARLLGVHVRSFATIGPVRVEDFSKRRSEFHLLDVREQDEWDAGHIDGAQHIPLGQLGARVAEVPKGRTVVTVCRSGARSDRAMQGLRTIGYQAENLEGGVTAWARAGLPLVSAAGASGRVI